jgi:hypothetical protein
MTDELRKRRTQSWADLDHIRRFNPRGGEALAPWPDYHREKEPKEKATSVFTIRLSKRDRDRLGRLQTALGKLTLNETIRAAIRAMCAGYCPYEED